MSPPFWMLQPSLKLVLVQNLYRHRGFSSNANSSIPCKFQILISCLNLLLPIPCQVSTGERKPTKNAQCHPFSPCPSTPPPEPQKLPSPPWWGYPPVIDLLCRNREGKAIWSSENDLSRFMLPAGLQTPLPAP